MSTPTTQPKKILIIDDEESIVQYLEVLLQDQGYSTISAADGAEGMEKAQQEHPDLICLDITMPEKSGVRFYRELRNSDILREIPVFVVTAVTGYGGDSDAFKRFLDTRSQFPPPERFFSKPIDREEFIQAVAEALG
jgi:CheY-like chemotaxis protein